MIPFYVTNVSLLIDLFDNPETKAEAERTLHWLKWTIKDAREWLVVAKEWPKYDPPGWLGSHPHPVIR